MQVADVELSRETFVISGSVAEDVSMLRPKISFYFHSNVLLFHCHFISIFNHRSWTVHIDKLDVQVFTRFFQNQCIPIDRRTIVYRATIRII